MNKPLTLAALALFLLWIASFAVLLAFLAGLAGIVALVAAIVMQSAVFVLSGAVLLVTNTRRPRGIDPDVPSIPVLYGRRKDDDQNVLDRLSAVLEEEAAKRPMSGTTPTWLTRKGDEDEEQKKVE